MATGNELADARLVAATFGTEHHELELSLRDEPSRSRSLSGTSTSPSPISPRSGSYALSRLAAEHVTVALSGQGADELLGGYRTPGRCASRHLGACARHLRAAPAPAAARTAGRGTGAPRDALTRSDPASRFLALSLKLDPVIRHDCFAGRSRARAPALQRPTSRDGSAGTTDDPLAGALYLDAQLGLVDDMLHYFDRVSMAHSLEVRVPFLDHHVVEYCADPSAA